MGKTVIYQMLPRLWGEGRFSSVDQCSLEYIKSLGITHIWYTGIIRHSTGKAFVKGNPGSPYAISDYYDVNPYLADNEESRMAELEDLIRRTHDAGLKVLIDFVPNHVGRDYGLQRSRTDIPYLGDGDDQSVHWAPQNDFFYYPGTALTMPEGTEAYQEFPARATGNNYTASPDINDWYDTIKINYCIEHTGTWDKMLDILLWWAGKGVDGFRCDMVELVPEEFFAWAIPQAKAAYPELIFVAEVYQKETYRKYIREVGFDFLYDKSGLYDVLRAVVQKNVNNSGTALSLYQSTRNITWNWQSLGDLQPQMLNFLENHDEQRFASRFFGFAGANSYAALHVSLMFNTAAFMLYFGEELGEAATSSEDGRTSIFKHVRISSIDRLYKHIHTGSGLLEAESAQLERYRQALCTAAMPSVSEGDTFDLGYCNAASDGYDPDRHFTFLRHYGDEALLCFCNFSEKPATAQITIPEHATAVTGIKARTITVSAGAYDACITIIPKD